MKYIILSLILTAILTKYTYSQEIKYEDLSAIYISPGLDIAWNFEGDFIIGPKISVGLIRKGIFYNLTLGLSSYIHIITLKPNVDFHQYIRNITLKNSCC